MYEIFNPKLSSIKLFGQEFVLGDSYYIFKNIIDIENNDKIKKIIYFNDPLYGTGNIIFKMKETIILSIPVEIEFKFVKYRLNQIKMVTSNTNTEELIRNVNCDIGKIIKASDNNNFNIIVDHMKITGQKKEDTYQIKIRTIERC